MEAVANYSFVKETIYNNNGKYGSDVVENILYKDKEAIGSMVHDLHGNKAVIKFDGDRYVLTPKGLFKKPEIISKNTGKTMAELNYFFHDFTLKEPSLQKYSLNGFNFLENRFTCSLFGPDSLIKMRIVKLLPASIYSDRSTAFSATLEVKGTLDVFALFCSFILMERTIVAMDEARGD